MIVVDARPPVSKAPVQAWHRLSTSQITDISRRLRPAYLAKAANRSVRMDDQKRQYISDSIRVIPDFPKPGIMFQDVTSLLLDHKVFSYVWMP